MDGGWGQKPIDTSYKGIPPRVPLFHKIFPAKFLEMLEWIFRDPLRGCSLDKFPYPRGEGELELDFVFKSMFYIPAVAIGAGMFMEGGWAVYLFWFGMNALRARLGK